MLKHNLNVGEVFSFMHTNKIGQKLSVFYIAWAFITERLGNLTMTDQIFLGHLGTIELAAAALGNTYTNLMW